MDNRDTIFALSSGQGKAGVAVIRVSGAAPSFVPAKLAPRMATLVDFYGIDKLIGVYFKAPNSFTGEDVVELHCHGGRAVIEAIFEKLRGFGFRMAERGEFSRRAFQNGKMDLVEVDGMRALIDARTERQRARALAVLSGGDSAVYMKWRRDMVELAALSAARLDYAADDLPPDVGAEIEKKLKSLSGEMDMALWNAARIRKIESGYNVALVGNVNVGKSSLFNRLVGEGRAIVSDIPGTTRDVISAELDIDGFLVRLSDTAGLRESNDEIEKIGIEKTHAEMKSADLVIRVFDKDEKPESFGNDEIWVMSKSDLIGEADRLTGSLAGKYIYVSSKTGENITALLDLIKRRVNDYFYTVEDDITVGDRARGHLERAAAELKNAMGKPAEIMAEHIGAAADEIGLILGIIGSDEIYDSVFGQLCLGK